MSTASGTNNYHGSAYIHRGTDALNAAPFFYNADPNIPAGDQGPGLQRYSAGGTLGGPIVSNKIFAFVSYQHIHDSDAEIGSSRVSVPPGLTNDRSAAALAALVNGATSSSCPALPCNFPFSAQVNPTVGSAPGAIIPLAFGFLTSHMPTPHFLSLSPNTFSP